MALANVDDLIVTAQQVADTDFDFLDPLRLAEVQAQLDLRLRMTEKEVNGNFVPAQDYVTLPADCVLVRHVRLNTAPIRGLDIVAPQAFDFFKQNHPGATPMVAMSSGLTLKLAPTPPQATPYTLFYDGGIVPLVTVSNPTNYLLTNYPNVLLYGMLVQYALGWLANDERAQGWAQLYSGAMMAAKQREAHAKLGGGPLAMRPDVWA